MGSDPMIHLHPNALSLILGEILSPISEPKAMPSEII